MDKIKIRLAPEQTTCAWGDIKITTNPLIGGIYVDTPNKCQDKIIEVVINAS